MSLKERFEQPTYVIYAAIESLLLSITDGKTPDHNGMKMIQENYSDKVDILNLDVEMPLFSSIFSKMQQWYVFLILFINYNYYQMKDS